MAEQRPSSSETTSDEIDLGKVFKMIKTVFRSFYELFLKLFLYIKKNALILIALIAIGAAIGFGLNQIVNKRLKTEIIVRPNLESRDYLYDVIEEIQANYLAKNVDFFKSLGIDITTIKGFEITIDPVEDDKEKGNMGDDLKYLELLEKFQNERFIGDVIRNEVLSKTSLNHRLVVYHKNSEEGDELALKIVQYINSNSYFNELTSIYRSNAIDRIEQNEALIKQINQLIISYSNNLANQNTQSVESRIILEGDSQSDVTELINLKNALIRDIERKKLELYEQKEAVSIINFGKMQQVRKSLLGKNVVLIPVLLLSLFFLISIIKFLNKEAIASQNQ